MTVTDRDAANRDSVTQLPEPFVLVLRLRVSDYPEPGAYSESTQLRLPSAVTRHDNQEIRVSDRDPTAAHSLRA